MIFGEDDILSLITKSFDIYRATATVEKEKTPASTKIATSQQENLREQQPTANLQKDSLSTAESTKTGVP